MSPPETAVAPVALAAGAAAASGHGLAPVIDLDRWNPAVAPEGRLARPITIDTDPASMSYEIDARGRLRAVSDGWDLFALSNGAPELERRRVIGRSLWDSIADDQTLEEHRAILERCRRRMQSGTYLFRCDAPFERRMLRMSIAPLQDGGFRFDSQTIAVQPRSHGVYERIMRMAPAPDVARCSHCNRFRFGREWLEPEHVVRVEVDDDVHSHRSRMIHTLCPECRAMMRSVPKLVRSEDGS